jgi:hypothetical protein
VGETDDFASLTPVPDSIAVQPALAPSRVGIGGCKPASELTTKLWISWTGRSDRAGQAGSSSEHGKSHHHHRDTSKVFEGFAGAW